MDRFNNVINMVVIMVVLMNIVYMILVYLLCGWLVFVVVSKFGVIVVLFCWLVSGCLFCL